MLRYLDGRVFTDVSSSSADEEVGTGDTLGANRWDLVSVHCLFSTAAGPDCTHNRDQSMFPHELYRISL